MKICQDISQEMAKVQSVINQFKELADKVAKAGSKEEIDKLQSEFANLKAENLDECIKQQKKLTALSMNFQRELERELELGEGKLSKKIEFDNNGYLIKLSVDNSDINLSEIDFSKTKIVEFNFRGNKGTKTLKTEYLPKNLGELNVSYSSIDLSNNDLSKTSIIDLNFSANKATKTLKTKLLPLNIQKLNVGWTEIDIFNLDFSKHKILSLNCYCNLATKYLDVKLLSPDLQELSIYGTKIDISDIFLEKTKIIKLHISQGEVDQHDIVYRPNKLTRTFLPDLSFLPPNLQELSISYSMINIAYKNLFETSITVLKLDLNQGTDKLNPEFLPKNLKQLSIRDSLLLKTNYNIVEKIQDFFKKKGQVVEIIYK